MRILSVTSIVAFVLGAIPLLALALLSPGLNSEGFRGYLAVGFGSATLIGLVLSAWGRRYIWILALLQAILIGLVLYETFSDAALYIGT